MTPTAGASVDVFHRAYGHTPGTRRFREQSVW